jgi:hypothetical protein
MSDQFVSGRGGENSIAARDNYVSNGLFGAIVIMACLGACVATIFAARYAWSWTPPSPFIDSAPKGGWPPESTLGLALRQVFAGVIIGAILGVIGGIGVMFLRSMRDPVVPP